MQQIKNILGCVLLAIFVASAVTVKADSVPDDVEFAVLKKFYDSLGGSAWTRKTNWPVAGSWPATATSAQFGTWYGVTVVNGDIAQIILNNNKLSGKLPSNIGDLKALKVLNLNTNATLNGGIPPSLSTISVLEQIVLNQCALSGTIPITIVNATRLTVLNLTSNKLTGSIPANIGNLTNLTQLWLSNNQLGDKLPASLGNLVNLTSLQLYTNGFTGNIPAALGNLKKLSILRLDDNQLTGYIPAVLGNLTALTQLYLQDNQLMGSIPPSLGYLVNLNTLYLQINKLTGQIPSSLGNLTKLQYLYLNDNALEGSLPGELANLTTLETLNVSTNKLTGAIPAVYSSLVNLQNFYVQGNKLSGSLPPTFSALTKLRYFYVNDNALTGGIPDSYTSLTQMVAFYLYNNQFSGSIYPGLFAGWTKLNYFYIHNNKFSGDFPSSIGSCPVLIGINASGNRFSTLPTGLLNLAVLAAADLTSNEIKSAPAFANHVNKANLTLKLNNNLLDFSVLESIAGGGIKSLAISPQNAFNDIVSTKGIMNVPLTITARDPGTHGTITWEKQQADGSWTDVTSQNQDATARTFTRNAFALTDEGTYRWKATNSAVTTLTLQSAPITVKQTTRFALDNWAYQYQYDGQRRVIGKKLPGADWVYMVYDERGRVVMTQDGEQRKVNQWSYVVYDAYNRPIITGVYTHSGYLSQADMTALISTTVFYETYTGNSTNHGYSNTVFASSGFVSLGFSPQTVTYYDNYGFKAGWGAEYNYTAAQIENQEASEFTSVIGQVTGVKVKTLEDQPAWLYTINYYDDKYRLIQSASDNLKGGVDRTTNVYDFTGKVLATRSSHGTGKITWQNLYAAKVDGDNLIKTTTTATWGGRRRPNRSLLTRMAGWRRQ